MYNQIDNKKKMKLRIDTHTTPDPRILTCLVVMVDAELVILKIKMKIHTQADQVVECIYFWWLVIEKFSYDDQTWLKASISKE